MLGDGKINLPENMVTVPPQIVLGIRPESVRIPQPGDTQIIQGKVFLVEHLGMHNLVSVKVGSSLGSDITVRVLLPIDQNWSDRSITLALPHQSVHWFDVQTGDALFRHKLI